jgi:hypothetical protein
LAELAGLIPFAVIGVLQLPIMPRFPSFITRTVTGTLVLRGVTSSWQFMRNEPSPEIRKPVPPDARRETPIAAGRPKPMVPSPPR